jgi:hypothetical protein
VASYTIIVTNAHALISPLHERMPVVLAPEDHEAWLDPKNQDVRELAKFLKLIFYTLRPFFGATPRRYWLCGERPSKRSVTQCAK